MTRILTVRHPVPVRYIPRGKRKEALALVSHATPVELREAAPSAFRPMGPYKDDEAEMRFFEHEGGIWFPLLEGDRSWGARREPLAVEGFVRHLGHPDMTYVGSDFHNAFILTPVMTRDAGSWPTRGRPLDPTSVRTVVEDGSVWAGGALRRFLDENVRVADGQVFLRWPGPLVAIHSIMAGAVFKPQAFPRRHLCEGRQSYPVRLADLDAWFDFTGGRTDLGCAPAGARPVLTTDRFDGFPPASGDDDLVFAANDVPRRALLALDEICANDLRADPDRAAWLRAQGETLRPWALRGLVGAVFADEAEEVLTAASRLVAQLAEARTNTHYQVDVLARFLDGWALPQVRRRASVPDDDLDALSGLSPSP